MVVAGCSNRIDISFVVPYCKVMASMVLINGFVVL